MKLKYFISVGLLIALPRVSMAQVQSSEEESLPRSTYTAVTVGMGGMYNQDQYLSPLPYGGKSYSISVHSEVPVGRVPSAWMLMLDGTFDYAFTLNPAGNAGMTYYRGEFHPQAMYRWQLPRGLNLLAGPGIRIGGGGRLHSRNGNNPATLDAKGDLTATVLLAYRIPSETWPVSIRVWTSYGLLGLSSSIGYGQSYYEQQFLAGGALKSLAFTAPHNASYSTTQARIDIPLWNVCTLQLGYRLQYDQLFLNGLVWQHTQHVGLIGFSFESLYFLGRRATTSGLHQSALFGI